MDKIQNIIYKYNPINLNKQEYMMYNDIIKYIHLDIERNKLNKDISKYFIEYFGDDRVIFNMRKHPSVYDNIYDELRK